MISPVNSPGSPGVPQGLMLPDIIITRRTRTISMNGRIEEDIHEGTVRFFCRSKGHGFLRDDVGEEHFVHVSDIESDFVPMKGDKVETFFSFFLLRSTT